MPRSHLSHNQWRILVAALTVTLLLCTGFQADAQQRRRRKPAKPPQQTANTNSNSATATPPQPTKKSLTALRGSETPEGGRATITSDAPLNDYEAYRSGNRYYVVIPQASAPSVPGNMRGRGFDDVQVHKRGNDTVLSFRLKPGATAHVNQKFNKLDVVFNSPADATSGAQPTGTTTANTPAGTTSTPPVTGNANSQRTGTETTSSTPKPPNVATGTGPSAATTTTVTPGVTTPSTNPSVMSASPTLTTEPGAASLPTVTPALGPMAETPTTATASPTPPTDQIAQAQPAASVPSALTTTPASSGTSLGAVLKSNWLFILIAALLLISIGLVAMTRSRRKSADEPRRISDDESPTLEDEKESASAMRLDAASVEGASAAVVAAPVDEAAQPVAAITETEPETVESAPSEAFNVERVRLEIKHVLTGEPYDETVINAPFVETRQLIESELLFALSRRNTERRHRALKAFTEHGYFDDATRDLRTAAVAAERAAAARKLGLTRDSASTPHLVAALEDSAPEVRRAAVEALTELQDPAAIAPLESLLGREEDRKVPHALIQRAMRASAVGPAEQEVKPASTTLEPASTAETVTEEATTVEAAPVDAALVETERVEPAPVEAPPVEEIATPIEESTDASMAVEPLALSTAEESLASATQAPATVEEETPTLEAEPAPAQDAEAAPAEAASEVSSESEMSAEAIALAPAIVAGLATAEAKASERRQAEADAARIHAEQEAQRQADEEERQRAEEEALHRHVEEAARLRAEAETQRLSEEARQREEEEQRRRLEEERLRVEEERRRVEEEQRRAEEERLAAEERRRAEERQRLEEERRRVEEEQRRAEEERLRVEEEQRRAQQEQQRAEEERLRLEAEAQRQREEEEAARQLADAERARAEEEERRRAVEENERREEEERLRAVEEERQRGEEARRQRAGERERRRAEEERARMEAEERERSEADAARRRAEDAALRLADMRRRMEEEARRREEAEAERLRAEEEARQRVEEEAARQLAEEEAEAARQQDEEQQRAEGERLRLEAEAQRQREEEEAARQLADAERARAEEQSRRYAEEERKRVEEETRQREEAEAARIEFEREAAERQRQAEAEAAPIEHIENELGQLETPPSGVQSDLFEATFTEQTPPAHSSAEVPATQAPIQTAPDWIDVDINETEASYLEQPSVSTSPIVDEAAMTGEADTQETGVPVNAIEESVADTSTNEIDVAILERGIAPADEDFATVPRGILHRLGSEVATERAAAVTDLARVGGEDAFREISASFDDPVQIVRDAAAQALFNLNDDHAASFTRALREAPAERRRRIGSALASSGLATQAIGHLMGESREKTYDAFSLLFLMSKAGEVQPLMRAIEEHPNSEVRLAVVKLLALSGQQDILPAFRRLAVRGSLPTEVRSAVMEAIYQISSQTSADTTHVA
jgi:hypothetical protein